MLLCNEFVGHGLVYGKINARPGPLTKKRYTMNHEPLTITKFAATK